MPAASWTLSVGGTGKSLEAWGITAPEITFRSLDEDVLSFTMVGNVYEACPMVYNDAATLLRDGTPYFVGTVTEVRAIGNSRRSLWQVTICNFWWKLKRTMFQQEMAAYTDTCVWTGNVKTTKCVLYQDPLTGGSITTGVQIQNVITYAALAGIPVALGSAPAFVNLPFETVRDLTLADVIRRCLQPTPDAVTWVDYSAGVPIFNCQQRALLTVASIDMNSSAPGVEEFDLRKRDDLVPTGVKFNYIGKGTCPLRVGPGCVDPATGLTNDSADSIVSAESSQGTKISQDISGLPDLPGGLIGTVDLAQLTDSTTESAPIGLAGLYAISLATPQWEGSISIRDQECDGAIRPGKVLNITNGNTAWTSMIAAVQQVRELLLTGQTTISVGPTDYLGPVDFVSLVQFTRRRALVVDAFPATRAPGTPEVVNCNAGVDPGAKDLLDKLKASGAAAAKQIGNTALGKALIGGGGGGAGAVSSSPQELCDGTTANFLTHT